jgi:hypothetical protein
MLGLLLLITDQSQEVDVIIAQDLMTVPLIQGNEAYFIIEEVGPCVVLPGTLACRE